MLGLLSTLPLISYHRFLLASHQNIFSDEPDCREVTEFCGSKWQKEFFLTCE